MTEPFDEYGERLRRVLHAEAEAVTPSPEGLERIREKINRKRERRFGNWHAVPWLRPLVAVSAAICITAVAVSATPALKSFVQTGLFSPEGHRDQGRTMIDDAHSPAPASPAGSSRPGTGGGSRPNSPPPVNPGTHIVTGRYCPPGEAPVTPQGGAPTTGRPMPRITCTSEPTVSTSPTEAGSTPPPSPTTQAPPSDQPTGGTGQPSAQASP